MKANFDQHAPFIDVFKTFNTFNSSIEAKKGNVQDVQVLFINFFNLKNKKKDHSIGRKIFQISGNVQAANYISIPDPLSEIKSLNLSHRYV